MDHAELIQRQPLNRILPSLGWTLLVEGENSFLGLTGFGEIDTVRSSILPHLSDEVSNKGSICRGDKIPSDGGKAF
jgi:hypothetical protein